MHLLTLSLSLLLSSSSSLSRTLVSASPLTSLSARADPSYGTTWNDPYISKPQNFQIRSASSSGCDFQLAYERDPYDNRHDVYYIAEWADGSS
jgi:hypothetical protein